MTAVIAILAAGASVRMRGRDKLLEEVDGEALLARQLRIAAELDLPVLVALPPGRGPRHHIADRFAATQVEVADARAGLSASVAAVAFEAERRGAGALLLVLADMPELEAADLAALLSEADAHPAAIVRAASEHGRPGHPVLFPRAFFPDLQRLAGDQGARDLLASAPDVRIVRLPGERALTDLDTPEAWTAWRASRPRC